MVKIVSWIVGICMLIIIGGFVLGMCGDAANTVHKEFAPSSLLKKYEYFKDLSAAIDKKRADIEMYKGLTTDSTNDRQERVMLSAEMRGIVTMHNELCAEYNSAMSKFNYRFTNAGDLPASNLTPLPREYKPYITSTK